MEPHDSLVFQANHLLPLARTGNTKSLMDAGGPLDWMAQLLGYEGVDTTRMYTTPSEQDVQPEVEKRASV